MLTSRIDRHAIEADARVALDDVDVGVSEAITR